MDLCLHARCGMDGSPGASVSVGPTHVQIHDVMRAETALQYTDLSEILVSNSTDIVIRTIQGQEIRLQTESYARSEALVSMINGYTKIHAGRSIAQYANVNCQFGAHFGPQDRQAAKACLTRYDNIPGAYYVRQQPGTEGYGLSVVSPRGEAIPYMIQRHPSRSSGYKYGIQDGLRYRTIDELIEHYHNDKDGLVCNLRLNVFALEHPEKCVEASIYASAEAAGWIVDQDDYLLNSGALAPAASPRRPLDVSKLQVDRRAVKQGAELCKGEFGQVCRGTCTSSKQFEVALETLKNVQNKDECKVKACVVQVDHSNVVELSGVFPEQPKIWIAKFVPGVVFFFLVFFVYVWLRACM
eukprot:TRINITY_DN11363_c0_g1_i1.p1 TRINITY_DN11363_c0_g1~~TRINITY_DN11363_c0_g1_i1.p1  ORF type:complete len:355 (+),score=62.05 TRINITY_DN11363_c0_g1_i1:841-1905(+)